MTARRLPAPLHPAARPGEPVSLRWHGRRIAGHAGEPLAVALLAAGEAGISRSFRVHRPRGLMCSTGQCGWCECEVDGRPSLRSCRVPVRDGLRARSEHGVPDGRRDVLGLVDHVWRLLPPSFYHHRFLRPRQLRKRYLDVLRFFAGRGRLRAGPRSLPWRDALEREVDVLVVGGGCAGLLAAEAAAESGASVLLLEAEFEPAAICRWRTPPLPDGRRLEALAASIAARVELRTGATLLGLYDEGGVAVAGDVLLTVHARATVVATGSYERLPPVPGIDRPGVIGARTVEWLLGAFGVLPGEEALLVGEADDCAGAEAALIAAGARVVARVTGEQLLAVEGGDRARAVRCFVEGNERWADVDLVVVGDRAASVEAAIAAGLDLEADGRGGIVPHSGRDGSTAVPGLFLAGAAAGRPIDSPAAVEAARTAGRAAAALAGTTSATRAARGPAPRDGSRAAGAAERLTPASVVHGLQRTSPADEAILCFCEDVRGAELRADQAVGYGLLELLKRRTGALTGPCQGKYCLPAVLAACAGAAATVGAEDGAATVGTDDEVTTLPTGRPPLRPVRLGDLAGPRSRAR